MYMIEIVRVESLDFEGKVFVFDNSVDEFEIGHKRYSRADYDTFHGVGYDAYYGDDDPENTIVKRVLEAGGIVRRTVSGKTDYYVVGESQNKNKDYIKQKEKGKPVVAISLDDLKRCLGLDSGASEKETGKLELIQLYDPSGSDAFTYSAKNVVVEETEITGDMCSDWEYVMYGDPEKLFIRDYIGEEDAITIPSFINGQKVHLSSQLPGAKSFAKCCAKTIKIPGSFTKIPVGLFSHNVKIEEVVLGVGVEEVETNFCLGASSLARVIFPDTIKEVGGWVLKGTKWYEQQGAEIIAGNVLLKKLADENRTERDYTYVVPDGVSCIAGYAFYDNNSPQTPRYITRVELPESVLYISDKAFFNSNMVTIKMPSTVVHFGENIFAGTRLEQVSARNQFLVIGDLLYGLYPNGEPAIIPEGVKRIKDNAIQSYSMGMLKELVMPDSVEVVGRASFAGCRNLKSVKLSNNLKEIGDYAFSGCGSLESIQIPETVETIGDHAFEGCPDAIQSLLKK